MGTSVIYFCVVLFALFCGVNSKHKARQATTSCESQEGCKYIIDSVCINNTCLCQSGSFIFNDGNITICSPCPDLGQYCGDVQCCRDSAFLICSNQICRCRNAYGGIYCWDSQATEPERFELLAQFILGLGLIFALAILASLIWRLCTRQDILQHTTLQREPSLSSLNSVQRLVVSRLQDRPPPYNSSYQPWKQFNSSEIGSNQNYPTEAPPPYTISATQVPITSTNEGVDNPVFISEEHLQDEAASLPITIPVNDNNDNSKQFHLPKNNFTEISVKHYDDQLFNSYNPSHTSRVEAVTNIARQ